jgi:CheY-like chemotaxis protein
LGCLAMQRDDGTVDAAPARIEHFLCKFRRLGYISAQNPHRVHSSPANALPRGVAGWAMQLRRDLSSAARVRKIRNAERKRLLVVEDNFHIGEILCDFLADHGMEPVGPAPTVEQALLLVEGNDLDAALLDIRLLGEKKVFPLCESLAARHVPFAFVTGWAAAEFPETVKGVPVIYKPFRRMELLRMVNALLKQS